MRLDFTQEGDMVLGRQVPLEKGKTYTFSLYARADKDGQRAQIITARGGHSPGRFITIDRAWKRYSLTFEAKYSTYCLGLSWLGKQGTGSVWADMKETRRLPPGETRAVWVDAYQIEEGDTLSPLSMGDMLNSRSTMIRSPQLMKTRKRQESSVPSLPAYLTWHSRHFTGPVSLPSSLSALWHPMQFL